jgi:hypothetical protein
MEDTFVVFLLLSSWEQKVNDIVARNSYGVLNYVQEIITGFVVCTK